MVDLARRDVLAAIATGGATALAGCQWDAETTNVEPPRDDARQLTDYEVTSVRRPEETVLFAEGSLPTETGDDEARRHALYGHTYLTEPADLGDLTFGDTPEARELAAFAEATALDGDESVYLFATPVGACHEVRLRRVEVDDGPSARFCRALRPADVDCDVEARESVGFAVRLPLAGDEFSSHGAGMSSSCRRPTRPEPFDPAEGEQ